MSRPNPYLLTAVLLAFTAVFGGFPVLQGGLYLDTHEADTYHHLDILFRMKGGQLPHSDFMTPLGLLAFLPVVVLMQTGLGVGMAFLWGQVAVALVLLPAVVYAALTRFPPLLAYCFAFLVLGLTMALTYGGVSANVSISMHYNRWAWAVSFVLLTLAILPSRDRRRPLTDGFLVGLLAAALLLLKVTFIVSLALPVALGLVWRGGGRALAAALAGGGVVVLAVTLGFGVDHWTGYLADLRTVAASDIRPLAGVPFDRILAGPAYLAGTLVALFSALLLRRAGRQREGMLLLLLIPALLYITYQNFGNDPKWLAFLPLVLLSLRPEHGAHVSAGVDLSAAAVWLSVAALALFAPSLTNLALSPLSHAAIQSAKFVPMLPPGRDQDIFIRADRAATMTAEVHLDETSPIWSKYAAEAGRSAPLELAGVDFPHCELYAGSRAHFVEIAGDLAESGVPDGSAIFTTDILTAFWLFGPFDPLENGAPWYYGGLSGLGDADYVLVPKCPFLASHRRAMVGDLKTAGVGLSLVRNGDLYALYAVDR